MSDSLPTLKTKPNQLFKQLFRSGFSRRLIASLLAFLILVPITLLLFRPSKASAVWFDDNYGYRQKISFTHNADIAAERAITFSLDTAELISAGLMQADCDDTRFTDINGKLLRFQLTGTCNNAATTYEIVFPTILNGTNIGYVYYANPAAASASQNVSDVTALTPSGGDPTITDRTNEEKGKAPVAWYKFDEGQGTIANNSGTAGSGVNGTLTGMASPATDSSGWSPNGKINKTLNFDGVDDKVITDPFNLGAINTLTYSAWVKNDQAVISGTQGIINKQTQVMALFIDSSSRINLWIQNNAAWHGAVNSSAYTDWNQWHHVVAVYNGANVILYRDGIQVAISG